MARKLITKAQMATRVMRGWPEFLLGTSSLRTPVAESETIIQKQIPAAAQRSPCQGREVSAVAAVGLGRLANQLSIEPVNTAGQANRSSLTSTRLWRSDYRCIMVDYKAAFDAVLSDSRYLNNLDWGAARPGHPEGTVRAHITEIEANLESLRPKLVDMEYWKLKLLIHTHDSFKADSKAGVAITDPKSHASLARAFLAEFCQDEDLLAMVQYHDEPFALWRQFESKKGKYSQERFSTLLNNIMDWNLFLVFNIVDGCTKGKSREPLVWLFNEVNGMVGSTFTAGDIL
jgi:hypothetical protein